MTLRNIISTNAAMRFMIEDLELCSVAGRQLLLSQEMICNADDLKPEFENLSAILNIVRQEKFVKTVEVIRQSMSQLLDIHGTIFNLGKAVVLDDIGLFEIKQFSLLSETVRENLTTCSCNLFELPVLQEVIAALDPDGQKLPQFYIYSSYSNELEHLRKKQQSLLNEDPQQAAVLRQQCLAVEDTIRQQLSLQLFDHVNCLQLAHENLAKLDILFAKALQAVRMDLVQPEIAEKTTVYTGLFNPQIKDRLRQKNKDFQPVDISLEKSPCLITGANMGGKTVLLKTVALAQYLFQFGFCLPAKEAAVVPVDEVFFSIEDDQSELSGLSSFAAEMLNINKILQSVRSGKHILALIDEPARTTNPDEGRALVFALLSLLVKANVRSLITTHYSNINVACRKLVVKGLQFSNLNEKVTFQNINNFMDYSLIEHDSEVVPHEALRIAAILDVDPELLEQATIFLKKN